MNNSTELKQAEKASTLVELLQEDREHTNSNLFGSFLQILDEHQGSEVVSIEKGKIIEAQWIEWLCRNSKTHEILLKKQVFDI
jgi:hypothetical protein